MTIMMLILYYNDAVSCDCYIFVVLNVVFRSPGRRASGQRSDDRGHGARCFIICLCK